MMGLQVAKVLVVEDDIGLAESIGDVLRFEKHEVEMVSDGKEAVERLKFYSYDLLVLDWNVPEIEGVEVLRQYRVSGGTSPALMLTAKKTIADKSEGFSAGADDYLTKPFDPQELIMRVRALLRRPQAIVMKSLRAGNVTLDLSTFEVQVSGEKVHLLPKEFRLLQFLIERRNQVFSVEDLLNRVWSSESDSSIEAVRKCITRIRNKIDKGDGPSIITTVVGLGYKVELPAD